MAIHPSPVQALDRLLFESSLVLVGAFRADPRHPRFHDSGPIDNNLFVFPRTSVWIQHEGQAAFVADPNLVTFYNHGQVYRRDGISEEGDRCEWFSVALEALLEAVQAFEPQAADRSERPFGMTHGPTDATAYRRQRELVLCLLAAHTDPLEVEETVLQLLDAVLLAHYRARGMRPYSASPGDRRHADLVEAAKSLLGTTFRENFPLPQLCRVLGVSPAHLCRVFRHTTGTTLHQYRDQLRLRTALEALAEPGVDLTQLALDLGYCSHSHFTERFRRAFGTTPSAFRHQAVGPHVPRPALPAL